MLWTARGEDELHVCVCAHVFVCHLHRPHGAAQAPSGAADPRAIQQPTHTHTHTHTHTSLSHGNMCVSTCSVCAWYTPHGTPAHPCVYIHVCVHVCVCVCDTPTHLQVIPARCNSPSKHPLVHCHLLHGHAVIRTACAELRVTADQLHTHTHTHRHTHINA